MNFKKCILTLAAAIFMASAAWAGDKDLAPQEIFIPYKELPIIFKPSAKIKIMERAEFDKLLKEASRSVVSVEDALEKTSVIFSRYSATIDGQRAAVTGELTLRSMTDRMVIVPLQFREIGLTDIKLDGKPAQVGFDGDGSLRLVLVGKGDHKLTVEGTVVLHENNAGMRFVAALPRTVSGVMDVNVAGDTDIQSFMPVSKRVYDKKTDRTTATVSFANSTQLQVVLLFSGNGRQEGSKTVLLGDVQQIVQIDEASQTLNCLASVLVLRRGVRELDFTVPAGWTVTDVSSDNMVKWSLAESTGGIQKLTVTMLKAQQGTQTVQIKAIKSRSGNTWNSPIVRVDGASFQRGYLCVDMGENLRVRSEAVTDAQREDVTVAPVFLRGAGSRLYSYWGNDWNVKLTLAEVTLRQTCKAFQTLRIDTKKLLLETRFDITAQGRQLYDMQFTLPLQSSGFDMAVNPVMVNGETGGFEYNVSEKKGKRTLAIRLARPVEPEAHAIVTIAMQSIPADWKWQDSAVSRKIAMPQIIAHSQSLSGLLSIVSCIDLAIKVDDVTKGLTPVPVGQMASLGLASDVQHAYRYVDATNTQAGTLTVSRQTGRIGCNSIGLVTVSPGKLAGKWRLNYDITRASMRELRFMAAKKLGRQISITVPGQQMLDEGTILPDAKNQVKGYNVWLLKLDAPVLGHVSVNVSFEQAMDAKAADIPLIRPVAGQSDELLAVQVSDEIAVNIKALAAREIDTVDLPPLPGTAGRLIAAYQLAPLDSPTPSTFALQTTVYSQYAIPAAFVLDANITTLVGPDGSQQTQASYRIMNAGMQFLRMALPPRSDLWSIRVGDVQARPQYNQAGEYLVPLKLASTAQTVTVVYAIPGGRLENLQLGDVKLPGIIVNNVSWRVVPPAGYHITAKDTSMQVRDINLPIPAYVQTLQGAGKFLSFGGIFTSLSTARELSKRAMTMTNLNGIGKAITIYQSIHNTTEWPENLDVLVKEGYASPKMLVDLNGYRFEYFRPTQPNVPGDQIVAQSASTNGVRFYLHANGSVSKVNVKENMMMADGDEFAAKESIADGEEASESGSSLKSRPASAAAPMPAKPQLKNLRNIFAARAEGRYTLPVYLRDYIVSGNSVKFTGMGENALCISVTKNIYSKAWSYVGFIAVLLGGVMLLRGGWRRKAWYVAGVLGVSTLCAVWLPQSIPGANDAFYGGLCMAALYMVCGFVVAVFKRRPQVSSKTATVAALIFVTLLATCGPTFADGGNYIVIPYEGDPLKAHDATSVMLTYDYYISLWNKAHPKEKVEAPAPIGISLGNVLYNAKITGEKFELVLTADVKTYHAGPQILYMPFVDIAVVNAEYNGKPAQLLNDENGMRLILPGKSQGVLKISAVTTCKILGQKGSAEFTIPPLPGAKLEITLPANMDLSVPSVLNPLTYKKLPSGETRWIIPLGTTNRLRMQWSPKIGTGNADKTLTGVVCSNVCAKPWALVGDSSVSYNFIAGQVERFGLLVPAQTTIVSLAGDNIRDFGVTGQKELGGVKYDIVEIRLQRPATKSCTVLLSWISPLPPVDRPAAMLLPQCADVARESGSVCLLDSGGVELKVDKMTGGRRTDITASADASTTAVAQYAWPYRPFELSVKIARPAVLADAVVNQLVRIGNEQVELFIDAEFTAKQGDLFGASFMLPAGYELTSVAGPAVEDWYARPAATGQRLDVNFRKAAKSTKLALALNKMQPHLAGFNVPVVAAIDAAGKPIANQTGRIAVQLGQAMDAQTLTCVNLKPVDPQDMRMWLDPAQTSTVRFAYNRDAADFSLKLKITPQPTQIRVEEISGITVQSTAANYTYLLRYFISGSPVDHVSFSLPDRYAPLVAVDSPLKRSVTSKPLANGRTQWTVWLQNEVSGMLDVTANFALPLDEQTTQLPVPQVQTDAPNGYKAVIAVRNLSRHKISLGDTLKLTAMPVEEQARTLPTSLRSNLLYIFQTFDTDWRMSMNFKPAPAATRVQAVIDLMAITTFIGPSGQCRYEVILTLQNRSEQFMRVELPKDLNLWSATVSGQPVKPVVPNDATVGEVLIPLVKTSPGGLPYDVKLYLGGQAVAKFSGLTKLTPPAVKIAGIGVMRTTWSLRLPGGYRYMGMEGNMSPIAGEAEIMSIELDAKLEQFKRMTKSYETMKGTVRQKDIARRNIEQFQRDVKSKIDSVENYIRDNRKQLSDKEYNRMQMLVGGQKIAVQEELKVGVAVLNKSDASQGDLNMFLNAESQANRGVSSVAVTSQPVPEFLRQAGEQQLQAIRSELNESLPEGDGSNLSGTVRKKETPWYTLLRYPSDANMRKIQRYKGQHIGVEGRSEIVALQPDAPLEELATGQAKLNFDMRRQKVEKQLQQATSNYYGGTEQQAANAAPQSRNMPAGKMSSLKQGLGSFSQTAVSQYDVQQATPQYARPRKQESQTPGMPCEVSTPAVIQEDRTQSCWTANKKLSAGIPIAVQEAELAPYVAGGTFSLPMTLPEGELHLDFAMPGSGAKLSIYAVPVKWFEDMWGTVSVLVGLVVFGLFIMIMRRISRNAMPSPKRILGVTLLAVFILMLAGTPGLALLLTVLLVAELFKCRRNRVAQ